MGNPDDHGPSRPGLLSDGMVGRGLDDADPEWVARDRGQMEPPDGNKSEPEANLSTSRQLTTHPNRRLPDSDRPIRSCRDRPERLQSDRHAEKQRPLLNDGRHSGRPRSQSASVKRSPP